MPPLAPLSPLGALTRRRKPYAVVAGTYRDLIIGDTPATYYRLGETVNGPAVDEQGANAGTYTPQSGGWTGGTFGAAGAISGDSNTAVTFNGVSGWVNCGTGLNFSSAMTLECWFYSTNQRNAGLVAKWNSGAGGITDNSYLLYLGQDAGNLRMAGTIFLTTNVSVTIQPTTAYTLNTWHHLVLTANGSALTLYYDGAQIGQTTYSGTIKSNTRIATLGRLRSQDATYPFQGRLDEVALYNTALTSTQVSAHYNKGMGL